MVGEHQLRSDMPNKITAHNAGWRSQFRFAGSVFWPGVCEFTSEVIRQRFFEDFFAGFFQGLLPSSTRSKSATSGLPFFLNAAS